MDRRARHEMNIEAFEKVKQDPANATLLAHPAPNAKMRLTTDSSEIAMGAVLEQSVNNVDWESLAFFSRKFTPAQTSTQTSINHLRRSIKISVGR